MNSTSHIHRSGITALALVTWVFSSTESLAEAARPEATSSVLGTIAEVKPETRTIVLRVGLSGVGVVLREFEVAGSTRIRVNGGVARLADVLAGQMARVTYARVGDTSVAELVDVMDAVHAPSVIEAAREASGADARERYLERIGTTLEVLEESIEELARHSELESTDQLTRRKETVEELKKKLADSRALLLSLSATSGQDVWRQGVDQMNRSLEDLNLAHERGWSDVR